MQSHQEHLQPLIASAPKKRRLYAFFFFLLFSTLLWLFVKFAGTYTISIDISLHLVEPPIEYWIPTKQANQQIKATVTSNGFKLLRFLSTSFKENSIDVPVNQLSFRRQNQNSLYLTASELRGYLGSVLDINENDFELTEGDVYFTVQPLLSKKVGINVKHELKFQDQYALYGNVITSPDSIMIYAPSSVFDTLQAISTLLIKQEAVNASFSKEIGLSFDPILIHPENEQVVAQFNIERFTESTVEIKIDKPSKPKMKLFPSTTRITYAVAMKDFKFINADQFYVMLDTNGISTRNKFLGLSLIQQPENIQVTRIEPDQIEYILLK